MMLILAPSLARPLAISAQRTPAPPVIATHLSSTLNIDFSNSIISPSYRHAGGILSNKRIYMSFYVLFEHGVIHFLVAFECGVEARPILPTIIRRQHRTERAMQNLPRVEVFQKRRQLVILERSGGGNLSDLRRNMV